MNQSKLIIVVRNDLKMPVGKCVAQCGHAVLGSIFNRFTDNVPQLKMDAPKYTEKVLRMNDGSALEDWVNGAFTKVTLKVDTEEEYHKLAEMAEDAGLPVVKIKDNARTVFKEPTYTTLCIGPCWSDEVDCITGDLKLL